MELRRFANLESDNYVLVDFLSLRRVSAVKESERIIFYLSTSRSISTLFPFHSRHPGSILLFHFVGSPLFK